MDLSPFLVRQCQLVRIDPLLLWTILATQQADQLKFLNGQFLKLLLDHDVQCFDHRLTLRHHIFMLNDHRVALCDGRQLGSEHSSAADSAACASRSRRFADNQSDQDIL